MQTNCSITFMLKYFNFTTVVLRTIPELPVVSSAFSLYDDHTVKRWTSAPCSTISHHNVLRARWPRSPPLTAGNQPLSPGNISPLWQVDSLQSGWMFTLMYLQPQHHTDRPGSSRQHSGFFYQPITGQPQQAALIYLRGDRAPTVLCSCQCTTHTVSSCAQLTSL